MNRKRYLMIVLLLSLAAAGGIIYYHGVTWKAALYTGASVCLVSVAVEDAATLKIHDVLSVYLMLFGIAGVFIEPDIGIPERIAGSLCVAVPMAGFGGILKGGFGGGDILLCVSAGFLLGWRGMLDACVIAFLVAGVYAAVLLVSKRARGNSSFAFGPFLCTGFYLIMLIG